MVYNGLDNKRGLCCAIEHTKDKNKESPTQ